MSSTPHHRPDGPVVVLGAAGEMMSIALERFSASRPDVPLALYDLDRQRLTELRTKLVSPVVIDTVDLFDSEALQSTIQGARIVVLGAGPYLRTAAPVVRACLDAGVDYLDLSDDVAPTLATLDLHGEAHEAGVSLFLGCGASPGLLNVMVVDAAEGLESVDSIDACWCTGDEGPRPYGAAVIEHLMHIAAGDCIYWDGGQAVMSESFTVSEPVEMGGGLGRVHLFRCAHPESTTLPRRYPEAERIQVLGGLDPAPVNAIARGVAVAVRDGALDAEVAIRFFQDIMQDKTGSLRGWRHALPQMWRESRRESYTRPELWRFVFAALRSQHEPYKGGLLARVKGSKDGTSMEVTVRTEQAGPDTFFWQSMGTATGTSTAAFLSLALDRTDQGGVFCPEDWVSPQAFYRALRAMGTPDCEIPTKSTMTL
jgi:saccharopine dehydrogenase-like NADP-dependent oxidoreductase